MRDILEQRPNVASRNLDEASAWLKAADYHIEIATRERPAFDFVSNAAYMSHCAVGFVRYGAAARVRVPGDRKRDDFFVHLPAKGKCITENRWGSFVCKRGRGIISSPAGHVMRSEAGSSRIIVSLTRASLLGQLAALLGEQPSRQLEFSPTIDLEGGGGRRFARHVRLLIADLEDEAVAHKDTLHAIHEQLIATALLIGQPHSYTDPLNRLDRPADSAGVRRVVDFIHARLDSPIALADLVAVSGVPGRTLQRHFQNYRGTTPMGYLREARLARIHAALLRADGDDSVTAIAMSYGVQHLGRFSIAYRRRFGESPSQTLRRRPR
jgi:AraC-like DNA-binding protein